MRKSDELASHFSCLGKAAHDEMIFVLRGKDIAAPGAIRAWCHIRVQMGKNALDDSQILEALACADLMEAERNK